MNVSRLVANIPRIRAGARVRAAVDLYFADADVGVDVGTEGDVLGTACGGALAYVQWVSCPGVFQTSVDCLEVVSS